MAINSSILSVIFLLVSTADSQDNGGVRSNVSFGWSWKGSYQPGNTKSWPKGSTSVLFDDKLIRVIPIPLFFAGTDAYANGHYGNYNYSRDIYKEEDGYYRCPDKLVSMHRETLEKNIDEAFRSGKFDSLYLQLNTTNSNIMRNILTNKNSVKKFHVAIYNYVYMCYDESQNKLTDNSSLIIFFHHSIPGFTMNMPNCSRADLDETCLIRKSTDYLVGIDSLFLQLKTDWVLAMIKSENVLR